METFKNPHNYGKIKNADGIGKVGNIVCGDVMWLYIKVAKNKTGEEIIKDVKFETFGCVAAISTSSIITDLVKGKTIKEALKTTKDVRSQHEYTRELLPNILSSLVIFARDWIDLL